MIATLTLRIARMASKRRFPYRCGPGVREVTVTSSKLFRLGALSAVMGGALMGLDVVLHLLVNDTLQPAELGGVAHELWHVPGMVGLPLALLGLVAIYLAQHREAGRLGLCGFFLMVIGMTVGAVYSTLFHGLFLPAVEGLEAGLFERLVSNTTAAQFYRGVVVQALGLGIGRSCSESPRSAPKCSPSCPVGSSSRQHSSPPPTRSSPADN